MLIDPNEAPSASPLTALSKGFADDLRRQGYAPRTILEQRRLLGDLNDWLQTQQLTAGDLSLRQVDRFLSDRRSAGVAKHRTRKALGPALGYLRGLQIAPPATEPVADDPASAILDRYRRFLTTERGLAPVTVERYVDCLRPFLDRRVSADGLELGGLTPADVISFVVARCPRQNRGVAKLTITALRSFLGLLHLNGVTERSLVCAVPMVARRRLAGLPKGLEPDQVRRLLASCDAHTPIGCRDLAILTLLVRLGLRRGEVAGLRLDDWRAGTIGGQQQLRGAAVADRVPRHQIGREFINDGGNHDVEIGDLIVQLEIAPGERLERDPIGGDHVAVVSQVGSPGGQGPDELHPRHPAHRVAQLLDETHLSDVYRPLLLLFLLMLAGVGAS